MKTLKIKEMKKIYLYFTLFVFACFVGACSEDDLNSKSIFEGEYTDKTPFDKWIYDNYTEPYNIDFKYRLEDKEVNHRWNIVPADYSKSVALAKLVKFLWVDAYGELMGDDFIKTHTPRIIQVIGSPQYNNNGTIILGTAEGGLKISLFNVNSIDVSNINLDLLNEFYFKTMHHEFSHILHQKKNFTTDFRQITADTYTANNWNLLTNEEAWKMGYISNYGSTEYHEDFVEMIAVFVTSTPEHWDYILDKAEDFGKSIILKKFSIIKDYLQNSWGVDIYKLREIVQRRYTEIDSLDLDNL